MAYTTREPDKDRFSDFGSIPHSISSLRNNLSEKVLLSHNLRLLFINGDDSVVVYTTAPVNFLNLIRSEGVDSFSITPELTEFQAAGLYSIDVLVL